MSVHFTLTLKEIQEHVRDGEIVQISIDPNKISFKRTHDNDGSNVEKRTVTHSSVETEHCDIYAYLPGAIENMEKIGRKQDFISLLNSLKCGHLDNNIALHLLLDVARFYSKDDIRQMKYPEESIQLWLTVKNIFKGRTINFFQGYKSHVLVNSWHPTDSRINFAAPDVKVLQDESRKYRIDAEKPGILHIPLQAFAEAKGEVHVKLSIDGQKVASGLGQMGEEDLCGHKTAPTLSERQGRLGTETQNICALKDKCQTQSATALADNKSTKQSLIVAVNHMSNRVRELRVLVVSRKRMVQQLLRQVTGD